MITFSHRGNFGKTDKFLRAAQNMKVKALLDEFGRKGIDALTSATPYDTGLTSSSWEYEVIISSKGYRLIWSNTHVVDGVVIAIILQYGHGTGTGGYVEGRDYINPAMQPVFDDLANKLGEEVSKL